MLVSTGIMYSLIIPRTPNWSFTRSSTVPGAPLLPADSLSLTGRSPRSRRVEVLSLPASSVSVLQLLTSSADGTTCRISDHTRMQAGDSTCLQNSRQQTGGFRCEVGRCASCSPRPPTYRLDELPSRPGHREHEHHARP